MARVLNSHCLNCKNLFYIGVMTHSHEGHGPRLMANRIHEILLVSSPYDLYLMEEEGLLADRISDEYAVLRLSNAPAITRVSTAQEALHAVKTGRFDLVITGMRVGKAVGAFDMARDIKSVRPDLPMVIITSERARIEGLVRRCSAEGINRIFYWLGDTRLFLAIIKLFEDQSNAELDCLKEQVRAVILVEDSPHFYSAYLPLIYVEILNQTRSLIAEGTSSEEKMLRMTSRPKILLADCYEEAQGLFNKYRNNVLGIISDIRFPRGNRLDPEAGFAFAELVKRSSQDIPILLQSQDTANAPRARSLGAAFIDKNSPHLLHTFRSFIQTYFGFGDFIFRMPDGSETGRVHTLKEMEDLLPRIPDESIEYHSRRNHFSHWLFARGEFELAARLEPLKLTDFASIDDIRQTIRLGLKTARLAKLKSSITPFSVKNFDPAMPFVRFGEGSIGGKGRGIAFMAKLLADPDVSGRFGAARVFVPPTAAIGIDIFERFLEKNRLHKIAIESNDDRQIAASFLDGNLDPTIIDELAQFLKKVDKPLAIRSSSLSEDSISQPFAGLYTTYFIPNNNPVFEERLRSFLNAIKLVYASTFFANPKAYMEAGGIAVESEKMAVLIQQLVGRQRGNYFYPDIAGVAQSYNFFPVGYLKPEDGVAQIVAGLGTMAVLGGMALRFSPKYPGILPQFTKSRDIFAHSQREFHALDLSATKNAFSTGENSALLTLELNEAEKGGLLAKLGGVYSSEDDVVYEGLFRPGPRIFSLKRVLSDGQFSVPKILSELLDIGGSGMGCAVEIEFAANLAEGNEPASLAFLQIRPLITGEDSDEITVSGIDKSACIAQTHRAMGNGVFDGIRNIVYVKPSHFDPLRTSEIASEIGKINSKMVATGESYILMGFGRWGTVNSRLGIPVAYAQVSRARVIVEISTPEINVEPSQGTHFFHNIASSHIGYLSIYTPSETDSIDWEWLDAQGPANETNFLRHVRLLSPAVVKIDGRCGWGVIQKPNI